MTTEPISLQDLRRSLYVKAEAKPLWRFWGLYVHVCKMETLREAYQMARKNGGAPGMQTLIVYVLTSTGIQSTGNETCRQIRHSVPICGGTCLVIRHFQLAIRPKILAATAMGSLYSASIQRICRTMNFNRPHVPAISDLVLSRLHSEHYRSPLRAQDARSFLIEFTMAC
jgi:hypothetical protein